MTEQPHWTSSYTLTKEETESYLIRILLPSTLITSPPSLELLSKLLLAHLETVPKDTAPLHVNSWDDDVEDSTPIILASNKIMPLGIKAFDRIVKMNSGAFCFALNACFAALLRYFGFRVSEMGSRCYQALGNDPTVHPLGFKWGTISHMTLVVDFETSGGIRYVCDTGFGGGGCSLPIPLIDGTIIRGLGKYEAFRLTFGPLPSDSNTPIPIDSFPGWTLMRRVPEGKEIVLPITDESNGFWSPLYFFHLNSLSLIDFDLCNLYSQSNPNAAFYVSSLYLLTSSIEQIHG